MDFDAPCHHLVSSLGVDVGVSGHQLYAGRVQTEIPHAAVDVQRRLFALNVPLQLVLGLPQPPQLTTRRTIKQCRSAHQRKHLYGTFLSIIYELI